MNTPGDSNVDVVIGGQVEGLRAAMSEAARAVQAGTGAISASFNSLQGAIGSVTKSFGSLLAVIAGGKMFKEAISDTVRYTSEVGGLARQMNLTAREAAGLHLAIDDARLTTEEFAHLQSVLNRQLRTNEGALNAMGIVTRDTNKQYVDQKTLLGNAIEALGKYKAGTDQNLAAGVAFGRGMDAHMLSKLQKVAEGMAGATEKAEKFGLIIGVENIKAAKEFKEAQTDVGSVMQGIKNAIGNALIPVFSQLMQHFVEAASSVIPVLALVFRVLATVLLVVINGLNQLWQVIKAFVQSVVIAALAVGDLWLAFQNLDWDRAKNAWSNAASSIVQVWKDAGDKIVSENRKTEKNIATVWGGTDSADSKFKPSAARSGSKSFTPFDKNAAKNELDEFKRHLKMMELAQGDYKELSKQQEADFWQTKLTVFKQGSKEYEQVQILYLTARRAAAKETIDIEKFHQGLQIDVARNNEGIKLTLANAWLARMKALYGEDSHHYRDALKAKLDAERAFTDQQRSFADMRAATALLEKNAQLDLAKDMLSLQVELGMMTKEEALKIEAQLIQEKSRLQLEEIERKRQLYADDLVIQKQSAEERKKVEIELQAALARIGLETTRAQTAFLTSAFDSLLSTVGNVLDGLLSKTMTWRQGLVSILGTLQKEFIKFGLDKLKHWVMTEVLMTSTTSAANAARAAAATAASTTAAGAKVAEATTSVVSDASSAAAGAASSQASIPFAGPYLAVAAAAAMLAFVLGFKPGGGGSSMPSAAGGWWNVPHDTLAMIHKDEKVFPADKSAKLDELLDSGGGGSRGGDIHIHATDADSVVRLFQKHGDALWDVIRGKAKNFKPY